MGAVEQTPMAADFLSLLSKKNLERNEITTIKMTALESLEWLERPPMVEEINENEEDDLYEPQVWDDFEETSERFTKSLYYGKSYNNDRLSLPVTELCVSSFNNLGLDDVETKLDCLNVYRAAEITRDTCASPTSLVLALMYLDRLRSSNTKYLNSISPTDLFLISLMVASKYLYDDGEEDEVFNDEWATSGNLEKKELNRLELEFLSAIDWNIYVSPDDYELTTQKLEWAVATKEVENRPGGWTTYTDINVLSRHLELIKIWHVFYEYTIKVTAVCAFAYAASLMTMIGTCHLLSRTQVFGPTSMHNSLQNLSVWKRKPTINNNEKPEILEINETSASSPEDEIEALNEKLRLDLNFGNETHEEIETNDFDHHLQKQPPGTKFCENQRQNDLLFRDDIMRSRLTRALFALKIGSFRDLMLGPQVVTGLGHV